MFAFSSISFALYLSRSSIPCNMIIGKNVSDSSPCRKRFPMHERSKHQVDLSLIIRFLDCFSILITLSEANHILLKGLICILYRISQNADSNGMNPFNLGLCVSNSLFKTESTTISSGKQEADVMSSIVEFLIENGSALFGSDVTTCVAEKRILIPSLSHPSKRFDLI